MMAIFSWPQCINTTYVALNEGGGQFFAVPRLLWIITDRWGHSVFILEILLDLSIVNRIDKGDFHQ